MFLAYLVSSVFGNHIKNDAYWWFIGAVAALDLNTRGEMLKVLAAERAQAIAARTAKRKAARANASRSRCREESDAMCGIAGLFEAGGLPAEATESVRRMLEAMQHRGPDGAHTQDFDSAVLGHARLAIIDLATGDQPQSDETGRIQVVVNGEIYNYRELRAELEARGHRFRTQSDIEVIPHLYREHGLDFVDHLRGMFAIALLDRERNRLVLVRDRVGKKPLYFAQFGGRTAFASEARCLEVGLGLDLSIDPEAVAHYLTWQYVPAPWSGRREVRKLEPATMLVVEADGHCTKRRYWEDLPRVDEGLVGEALLDRLEATLDEAARLRLRADVPLAAFLSGGIDSGLVCAALAREAPDLSAITVRFQGAEEDEGELTRATAGHLGMELAEEEATSDLLTTVDRVLQHLDEPLGDASCVPTFIVCEAAARRVKVALSGDGGDEAFAGYPVRYGHNLATQRLRRLLPGPPAPRAPRATGPRLAALAQPPAPAATGAGAREPRGRVRGGVHPRPFHRARGTAGRASTS